MNTVFEEKLDKLKQGYLGKEVYIMVNHSNFHGDISFPIGTIIDVYLDTANTVKLKWEKKHELPWNVSKHYMFSEYDLYKFFETEHQAKEYYRDYI